MPIETRNNRREEILDIALALMSDKGLAGTSMRKLANACDLNVAALYHYFPSKQALFEAVIAERQYGNRIAKPRPSISPHRWKIAFANCSPTYGKVP